MFYDVVPVEHELIISVGVNTFKTKDILVFSCKGYLSMLGPRTFIFHVVSHSKTQEKKFSPPSL